jgi:hypothetical protein
MSSKYYISVSEPWDFEGPDGGNIIKGDILQIVSPTCIIFKSNSGLKFDDNEGNLMVLSPRHYESDFQDLSMSKVLVPINGGLFLGQFNENLTEKDIREKAHFSIIGSIRSY